ncbi:MAG TPA: hypothetical protein VGJ37_13735 [Pyrinomonadaceae bacterium]
MKADEGFDYSDDGLYPTDDIYGATSDFWGDADNEESSAAPGLNSPQTALTKDTDKTPS